MADFLIDINTFSEGLQVLEESTDAPLGSARVMDNMIITDRGGISPRPGTAIYGTWDSSNVGSDGFYNFLKSGVQTEIPVKAANGVLKYYHPTLKDWYTLQTGYTVGKEFGFKEHLINTDNEDYLYFGNSQEPYSRWQGSFALTTVTLSGGETTITVDTTLKPTIYDSGTGLVSSDSGTSTAGTSTVLTDGTKTWTTNQWAGFTLSITSGSQSGQTATIISNDVHTVTIAALPGAIGAAATYTIGYTATIQMFDSSKTWATGQWINFYIHITSGAAKGAVSLITASGPTYLTFNSISGLTAGQTYEIRMLKFPVQGTLVLNGTNVVYSALSDTTFTVASAPAAASSSPVSIAPTTFPANPRGNRFENHHSRMVLGNVQSAISRDASGNPQGSQSSATVYVSKIKNATDFTFSFPRVAGEGDVITFPYGGGNINDIANFEDSFIVGKKYSLDLVKYSTTDANDIASIVPMKQGYGTLNHFIKGRDDVYFVTTDNQLSSVSRVQLKDTIPQTTNIGLLIKRLLDTYNFTSVVGHEYAQRILFACKKQSIDTVNNQIIVYNKQNKSFEGIWYLNAMAFDIINGQLYAADSQTPNVYQLFTGVNDVRNSTTKFGISASWRSNWIHVVPRRSRFRVKPSQFSIQGINSIGFQGYITDGTIITFSLMTDFTETPVLQFNFGILPTDEAFMQGAELGAFLGNNPLGLEPLGSISDPNPQGQRHFKFVIYFPDVYSNYLSVGIDSAGTDQSYELTRLGLGTTEDSMQDEGNIKSITN